MASIPLNGGTRRPWYRSGRCAARAEARRHNGTTESASAINWPQFAKEQAGDRCRLHSPHG
ncbi:MAG TPA: hypothetical protein PLR35_18585, partial [Burkholderiaceae bacterium]|nr:hypothetical protein [Burkholderiaceae bacterium]